MSARASQLRRQRDAYLDRIAHLEAELRKVRNSVFRKRNEIRLLIRQLEEWKLDHTLDVTRVKEIQGLQRTLRSERYIKGVELERIKTALCGDPECEHCRRVEAAMPDGGPFRSETGGEAAMRELEAQRNQLDQQVRELEARLAECYGLTGSDPDGASDSMLAQHAVQAVRELRGEADKAGEWEERAFEAERQVRELLAEMTRAAERLDLADNAEWGDDFEAEARAVSEALTAAADKVRKERGDA